MSWKAITREQMSERLEAEVQAFSSEHVPEFIRLRVSPFTVPCVRSETVGVERIFVVARKEDAAIIFDDVEDEFGTTTLVPEDPIRDWSLCGPLWVAVNAMRENA